MKLLPCPFCGSVEYLELRVMARQDRMTLNKIGKPHRRVNIEHKVECINCGVTGPQCITPMPWRDEPELTEDMVEQSADAAAFVWNKRQPVNDRAYDLVNRLIVDALHKIDE